MALSLSEANRVYVFHRFKCSVKKLYLQLLAISLLAISRMAISRWDSYPNHAVPRSCSVSCWNGACLKSVPGFSGGFRFMSGE